MRRINILLRSPGFKNIMDGPAQSMFNLVGHLLKKKFGVTMVFTGESLEIKKFRKLGVNCYVVGLNKKYSVDRISKIIVKNNVSISQTNAAIFDCANASFRLGIPHIWYVRSILALDHPDLTIKQCREYLQIMGILSRRIVTNSKYLTRQFDGLNLKSKITTIYKGVDFKQFLREIDHTKKNNLLKEFKISYFSKIIGMIANLNPQKNHLHFIKMASKIRKRIPNTFFLIIGGKIGNLFPHYQNLLKNEIAKLNLSNSITLTGFRKDIKELISLMDILLLPSLNEGAPRVILEAMALRKPVVIYKDSGGQEEFVKNNETGFIVKNNSISALANASIKFLQNEPLRKKIGEHARERLEKYFNSDIMLNKFEKLYRKELTIKDDNERIN